MSKKSKEPVVEAVNPEHEQLLEVLKLEFDQLTKEEKA